MKILYDNWIYNLQNVGGVSRVWSSLLENISSSDMDISVLGTKNSKNLFFSTSETVQYVTSNYKFSYKYIPFFHQSINNYNIYHSSYLFRPKNFNGQLVFTVHDLIYFKFDTRIVSHLYKSAFKSALKSADGIVCVSDATKRDLLNLFPFLTEKLIKVIPNGINDIFFSKREINISSNLPSNYALYVGSRGKCKNFNFVLEIASSNFFKANNLKLVCVTSSLSKKELNAVANVVNYNNIVFIHDVSDDLLFDLYKKSLFLLIPSLYEGFGLPAAEAMAVGTPVIHSGKGSLSEVVGNDELCLSSFTISAFNILMEKFSNAKFIDSVVAKQNMFAQKYRWSHVINLYIDFYHELYSRKK